MDSHQILFVDDEPNVLDGIRRTLYDQFDVCTASSGEEALALHQTDGPFAVVVSDMRMPVMDGAELLARFKALSPDTTRVLLTGHSELDAAVKAINEGQLFRFLSKPCPKPLLVRTLTDAVTQYRLVTGERQLLEQTLNGAVELLVQVLSLAAPVAFVQGQGVRACVSHLVRTLGLRDVWRFEMAALLFHMGYVAVPPSILHKIEFGEPLSEHEQELVAEHPEVAYKLLAHIPRLEDVALVVRAQRDAAYQLLSDEELQRGADCLSLAIRLFELVRAGHTVPDALRVLADGDRFDDALIQAARSFRFEKPKTCAKRLGIEELTPGMVLEKDVVTPKGAVVVPAGREVTRAMVERLRGFARGLGVREPIHVLVEV